MLHEIYEYEHQLLQGYWT